LHLSLGIVCLAHGTLKPGAGSKNRFSDSEKYLTKRAEGRI
jgi:hypothetical protein